MTDLIIFGDAQYRMEIDKNAKEIRFFVEGVNVGGFNEQGFQTACLTDNGGDLLIKPSASDRSISIENQDESAYIRLKGNDVTPSTDNAKIQMLASEYEQR